LQMNALMNVALDFLKYHPFEQHLLQASVQPWDKSSLLLYQGK